MMFEYYSKQNFSRKKQTKEAANLFYVNYLYTETIKRLGEILLHGHFNRLKLTRSCLLIKCNIAVNLSFSQSPLVLI